MQKNKKQAFTLVELIIVVTILAILATISFMSFQGYTSKTRDSKRVTELKNIEKGLQIYQTQVGKYPIPDDKKEGTFDGTTLVQVGYINTILQQILKISELPKDAITNELVKYGITNDGKSYQLSTILENTIAYTPLVTQTYAQNYISYVKGSYKGLYKTQGKIYNIPSLILNGSGTTIDLTSADMKYVVNNETSLGLLSTQALEKLTGTGNITLTGVIIPTDWKTNSGTLSQTLGYNVDEIGQIIYGDKYLAGDTTTPTNTQIVETPETPTKITITGDETNGRKWSDNTYATSCNGYKNPTGNNEYSGNIGDGVYLIKPDANTEFKVYCDMTTDGGGWTKIIIMDDFSSVYSYNNSFWTSSLEIGDLSSLVYKSKAYSSLSGSSLLLKSDIMNAKLDFSSQINIYNNIVNNINPSSVLTVFSISSSSVNYDYLKLGSSHLNGFNVTNSSSYGTNAQRIGFNGWTNSVDAGGLGFGRVIMSGATAYSNGFGRNAGNCCGSKSMGTLYLR